MKAVERWVAGHHAVLLANHGPVVAGTSLAAAPARSRSSRKSRKLFLMLRSLPIRPLTPEQVAELRARHNLR